MDDKIITCFQGLLKSPHAAKYILITVKMKLEKFSCCHMCTMQFDNGISPYAYSYLSCDTYWLEEDIPISNCIVTGKWTSDVWEYCVTHLKQKLNNIKTITHTLRSQPTREFIPDAKSAGGANRTHLWWRPATVRFQLFVVICQLSWFSPLTIAGQP